jgi:hypothetical protein
MVTAGGEGDQTREVKREFNQNGFVGESNQIVLVTCAEYNRKIKVTIKPQH